MNVLLDTHMLVWMLTDQPKLPARASQIIEAADTSLFYSIVTPWEMAIKEERHPGSFPIPVSSLLNLCSEYGISQLPLEVKHIEHLSQLEYRGKGEHHDPFDRIMLCQADVEGMLFLTHDKRLERYGLANVLVV